MGLVKVLRLWGSLLGRRKWPILLQYFFCQWNPPQNVSITVSFHKKQKPTPERNAWKQTYWTLLFKFVVGPHAGLASETTSEVFWSGRRPSSTILWRVNSGERAMNEILVLRLDLLFWWFFRDSGAMVFITIFHHHLRENIFGASSKHRRSKSKSMVVSRHLVCNPRQKPSYQLHG